MFCLFAGALFAICGGWQEAVPEDCCTDDADGHQENVCDRYQEKHERDTSEAEVRRPVAPQAAPAVGKFGPVSGQVVVAELQRQEQESPHRAESEAEEAADYRDEAQRQRSRHPQDVDHQFLRLLADGSEQPEHQGDLS